MSRWQPVLLQYGERPSQPSHISPSDRRIKMLALVAVAVTVVLIGIGAMVRATGSGLGCPGWPKCFGRWIPPLRYHAVIEYSHRLTAFIDVVAIAALAVTAWRRYRRAGRIFWPSMLALGLVVFQAILGAIVVKGELKALLVTAHLSTAMVLVATLVYVAVSAFTMDRTIASQPDELTRLARIVAGSVFALVVVGAYVRGEGAGLAFGDWPLMNGRLVPDLSASRPALHFVHRLLALVVGGVVVILVARAWQWRETRPVVTWLAVTLGSLFVAQVLVGAANVWSRLAPAAVVAHVTLAALIWSVAVATALTARLSERVRPSIVARAAPVGRPA